LAAREGAFPAALEREPATRDEYLEHACAGDADLGREVDSLIARHRARCPTQHRFPPDSRSVPTAWRALYRIEDLVLVQAMLGRQDEAIDRLESLLSRHCELISSHVLRLDPLWNSLSANPRFQILLTKYDARPEARDSTNQNR